LASVKSERPITVYAAIVSNLIIAGAKFVVGILTGSSAMLSEGIHSTADTGNELLLLLGVYRSRKPADEQHPFGHGKELYFWSLIVAMVLFGVGGGMSFYEGITHLRHPTKIRDPTWNYVVLGIALLSEGTSWTIAFRQLQKDKGQGQSFWQAVRASKDPTVFIVLGEDSAALIGLAIAFLGVFLSYHLGKSFLDSTASIAIGLLLTAVAGFLASESRGLLVGERATKEVIQTINSVVRHDPAVVEVRRLLTMQLGPDQLLLNMDVQFDPGLSAAEIAAAIRRLETHIREQQPDVTNIFIETRSLRERDDESVGEMSAAEAETTNEHG
jgi:cation diffusion facilitator family transporter